MLVHGETISHYHQGRGLRIFFRVFQRNIYKLKPPVLFLHFSQVLPCSHFPEMQPSGTALGNNKENIFTSFSRYWFCHNRYLRSIFLNEIKIPILGICIRSDSLQTYFFLTVTVYFQLNPMSPMGDKIWPSLSGINLNPFKTHPYFLTLPKYVI